MKTILKWIGIVLAALIGLIILAVIAVFVISNARINATYDVEVKAVKILSSEEDLEQGQHISIVRGCRECHLADLSGGILIDDPAIGQISSSNLTSGQGGIGGSYTNEDWVRAIRRGIGPDGKPLIIMPAHEFYVFSDDDMGALLGHLQTVPAVDNQPAENTFGFLGRLLFLTKQFDLIPAEKVDHDAPRPVAPKPGVTAEYGQYMAVGCTGCHGPGFSGGPIPAVPPEWPDATNLTPGGDVVTTWTEQEFMEMLRTGFTPSGKQINPTYMPWAIFGQMTDEELKAIWLYLQSLPAKESGNR